MNHTAILSRAWRITLDYRVLWLFGFLVALGGGGGGGGIQWIFGDQSGGAAAGSGEPAGWDAVLGNPNLPPGLRHFLEILRDELARYQWEQLAPALITLAAMAICCLLIVIVVLTILHYIARVALIRGVDRIEATGAAPTWREGFRLGWSQRTFRLFVLELLVFGAIVFCIAAAVAMVAVPLLTMGLAGGARPFLGIAIGLVLLFCLLFPFVIAISIALGVLGELWAREITLAGRGIGDAIAEGWHHARQRLAEVGLLWLLLLLVGWLFTAVFVPLSLVVLAIAGSIGLGIGYTIFAVAGSALWALGIGGAAFLLFMMIPLTFVLGLWEVFKSSAWTLAWRSLAYPAPPPEPDLAL